MSHKKNQVSESYRNGTEEQHTMYHEVRPHSHASSSVNIDRQLPVTHDYATLLPCNVKRDGQTTVAKAYTPQKAMYPMASRDYHVSTPTGCCVEQLPVAKCYRQQAPSVSQPVPVRYCPQQMAPRDIPPAPATIQHDVETLARNISHMYLQSGTFPKDFFDILPQREREFMVSF